MTEKEKQYDEEGRVIRENRSALKRERDAIKAFAEELLKLPAQQYPLLPINEALIAALIEGKRLNGNAYQRHLNYLTRLMIEQNPEAIRHAHEHINHPYLHTGHKIQQIQSEIVRLLQNDKNIYNELIARYQDLDIQYVRQLVRETQKHLAKASEKPEETQEKKPGKHQRRLQKYLQSLPLNFTATE
ncbi:ribosome biogenesis factor YjgA [Suttonella ornithocola]|uniref:Protein of uncharacterized function (DUF615) n=1 Tax=Suttonella ornithocola TaxID=279832 RepID=A0A380MY41_9GAMM|nr:ribosome biogenesis factor YjgA [Suttonella ornithocola]SUO97134.1 Protein of uncharacterised function (DUF615) [Suttonella ornithocola]